VFNEWIDGGDPKKAPLQRIFPTGLALSRHGYSDKVLVRLSWERLSWFVPSSPASAGLTALASNLSDRKPHEKKRTSLKFATVSVIARRSRS
jgi:hypothetical protein